MNYPVSKEKQFIIPFLDVNSSSSRSFEVVFSEFSSVASFPLDERLSGAGKLE